MLPLAQKQILAIEALIKPYIYKTPLKPFDDLKRKVSSSADFHLKCEQEQKTGSFKVRGAAYKLLKLSKEEKNRGVIARSSGNFSSALAHLCQEMGIKCTLVLSTSISEYKLDKTRQYGAEIVIAGDNHQESMEKVLELQKRYNYTLLHPYDDLEIIFGQGSLASELLFQNPDLDTLVIPLGGGGLASGCALTFKSLKPEGKVFTVEPSGAKDYLLSCQKKERITLDRVETIADGLRAPCVGKTNWPYLQEYVDKTFEVSDQEIINAMAYLYKQTQMMIEPSGAVTLACALKYPEAFKSFKQVALILSGGNIAEPLFFKYIDS